MARIRTFLAIDPGKPIRERALALQNYLAETGVTVKWVESDNLHLTLIFLGEVEDRNLMAICRATAAEAGKHEPFPLTLAGAGCFPNERRPRVLWIGVSEGAEEVCSLQRALEGPLLDLGCYRREERAFTPHLTLGRVQSDQGTSDLSTALARKKDWQAGTTTISEVLIMSSELRSKGPVYTVMGRAKLGGGSRP
jgi:RNA 2',3'-cyclic 3'-phosphodiesterase